MSVMYPHHIPITRFQKVLLGVSSAVTALRNPYRDDMVAVCGETTASCSVDYMKRKMESNETGKRILAEKPRLSTSSVDLKLLRGLPPRTLGRQYADMLVKYNITPDSRRPVKFIDNPELAYVLQRYREVHDFNHLLLDQPTNLRGEVAVKWFEAIQTSLPMCWLAAAGGTVKLSSARRKRLFQNDLQWVFHTARQAQFFMNVYFEKRFDADIDDLREELGIDIPKMRSSFKIKHGL